MRKRFLMPLFAIAAGVAGFLLRNMQRETGFESDTGLQIVGNPWNIALIALSIVVAIILIAAVSGLQLPQARGGAELGKRRMPYFLMSTLGSLFLLVAALLGLRAFTIEGNVMRNLLLPLLGIVTVICTVLYTSAIYKGADLRRYGSCAVIPVFFACFLLVVCYKERAADPVIIDYVYEFFAVMCAILSFYYGAGFFFLRGRPRPLVLFSLLGAYFILVAAADGHTMADYLIFAFMGVHMMLCAGSVISAGDWNKSSRRNADE